MTRFNKEHTFPMIWSFVSCTRPHPATRGHIPERDGLGKWRVFPQNVRCVVVVHCNDLQLEKNDVFPSFRDAVTDFSSVVNVLFVFLDICCVDFILSSFLDEHQVSLKPDRKDCAPLKHKLSRRSIHCGFAHAAARCRQTDPIKSNKTLREFSHGHNFPKRHTNWWTQALSLHFE